MKRGQPGTAGLLPHLRAAPGGVVCWPGGPDLPDGTIDPAGTILALTIIGRQFAEPGAEVSVVWGEHPGAGTSPDADLGFPRIRATVAPAPYDAHARTQYRRS